MGQFLGQGGKAIKESEITKGLRTGWQQAKHGIQIGVTGTIPRQIYGFGEPALEEELMSKGLERQFKDSFISPEERQLARERNIEQFKKEQLRISQLKSETEARIERLEVENQKWLQSHPDLIPSPGFEQPMLQGLQDPKLKGRRGQYIAYKIAEGIVPTLASLGAGVAVGIATGSPVMGAIAAGAVMYPMEHAEVYQAVVDAGGTHQQAADLSGLVTPMIAGVEYLANIVALDKLTGGSLSDLLRKEMLSGIGKIAIPRLVAMGVKDFATLEASEITTEVIQQIIQNAAVKFVDRNHSLFEQVPETAVQTAFTMAPIGGVAGVSTGVRTMQARGIEMPQLPELAKRFLTEERGGIGGEPEVPPDIQKAASQIPKVTPEGAQPVTPAAPVTPEVTEEEISLVTKTARITGAIGARAITPKHVSETSNKTEHILDYGSGKNPIHTFTLREQGFNVDAYDIGDNFVEGVHIASIQPNSYDTVFASNVLNVAPSENFLRKTLLELQNAVKQDGRVLFNYPVTPRKLGLTIFQLGDRISDYFTDVKRVGGTNQAPLYEAHPKPVTHEVTRELKIAEEAQAVMPQAVERMPEGGVQAVKLQTLSDVELRKVYDNSPDLSINSFEDVLRDVRSPEGLLRNFYADRNTMTLIGDDFVRRRQPEEAVEPIPAAPGLETTPITEVTRPELVEAGVPPVIPPTQPLTTEMAEFDDAKAKRVLAEFEKIHQYYKGRIEAVQEIKQSLVDFAKSLPIEVKGKLLATVKNVKTPLELSKAFDYIGELMQGYQSKAIQASIKKELSVTKPKKRAGKYYGKYTADVQEKLDFIRKNSKATSSAIEILINENVQKITDGTIDADEGVEINALLRMSNIKAQNNTELQTTLDAIRNFKETGKTEILQKRIDARKKRIGFETVKEAIQALNEQMSPVGTQIGRAVKQEIINKVIQTISGKPKVGPEIITGRKNLIERMIQLQDNYIAITNMMESFLDSLDTYEDKGLFKQVIWEGINKATDSKLRGSDIAQESFARFLKNEKINLAKIEIREVRIGNIDMKGSDRIGIYLASQDAQAKPHMIRGNGVTEQNITEAINSLNADEKKVADWLQSFYDGQFDSEAETHELITGTQLKKRDKYFPIFILPGEVGGEVSMSQWEAQGNLLENKSLFPSQLVNEGHRKSVIKGAIQLIRLDAFSTFDRYVNETEQDKAFSLVARDLQQILKDREFANNFKTNYGYPAYQVLNNWLKRSVATYPMAVNNKFEGVVRTLRGNAATFALSFNVLSGMRATLSYWNGVAEIGNLAAFQGLISNTIDSKGTDKLMREYSPQARHRVAEREFVEMQLGKKLSQRGKLSVKEWLSIIYRINDRITTGSIWRGAYDEYLRKNTTALPQEAAHYADEVMRKTQPTYSMKDIAEIYNSGELAKAMTMFTNQLNRNWNYMKFDVLGKLGAGRISPMTAAHRVITGYVIPALLLYIIANAMLPKKPEDVGKAIGKNLIAMLPILGPYISAAMDGYMFSGLITTEGLEAIQNTVYQMNKGNWDKALSVAGTLAGVTLGLPTNPIRKIWASAKSVIDEEGNPLLRLIYGEYKGKRIEEQYSPKLKPSRILPVPTPSPRKSLFTPTPTPRKSLFTPETRPGKSLFTPEATPLR